MQFHFQINFLERRAENLSKVSNPHFLASVKGKIDGPKLRINQKFPLIDKCFSLHMPSYFEGGSLALRLTMKQDNDKLF